ncbi:MAG: carbon-nitrogen hydrolase family protein [Pseudomonadales bacterium]|nr:carbon-nitrogen hydrolase family protein [Pseudomonadales bacterium]
MSATKSRVAVVQMVSTADIHANLEMASTLTAQAVEQGAQLVLLPENFAVLDGGPLSDFAERQGDPGALLQKFASNLAARHRIYLAAGTVPLNTRPADDSRPGELEPTDGRVRSASLLYGPEGSLLARYDKIHLFDVEVDDKQANYSESLSFEPGEQLVAVDTALGRIGMSVCYDLRFPELYRSLLAMQAELLLVPSAFTQVTGKAHWEVLLRARAIENQCYVIAANQGGVHNATRETYGHSMIVDPWGEILARVEEGPGVAVADIDLDRMVGLRQRMPVISHRRL